MPVVEFVVIPKEAGHITDYASLSSATVQSEVGDPLSTIITKAERELGEGGSLGFLSEPDESGARYPTQGPSAVPTEDGSLRWLRYADRAFTLAELDAAKEESLFDGDTRLFVLDRRPIGNGGLTVWSQLDQWIDSAGPVASAILAIRGLFAILLGDLARIASAFRFVSNRFRIRRDTKWLTEFLTRNKDQWIDAGAASPTPIFFLVLKEHQWDASRLARYMRLSLAEARRFLEVMGYELSPYTNTHVISRDAKKLRVRKDFVRAVLHFDPLEDVEDYE